MKQSEILSLLESEIDLEMFYCITMYPSAMSVNLQGNFDAKKVSKLKEKYEAKFEVSDDSNYVEAKFEVPAREDLSVVIAVHVTLT